LPIENTGLTTEAGSTIELNKNLKAGWLLILSYMQHSNDNQQPRFVLDRQKTEKPIRPDLFDGCELREID